MDKNKKRKLEKAGWRVGTTSEFLGLSPVEEAIIELRLRLGNAVREKRLQSKMTQEAFAAQLKTSQSRLNKIEAGNPSVSFDLQIKSLISAGVTVPELSKIISGPTKKAGSRMRVVSLSGAKASVKNRG